MVLKDIQISPFGNVPQDIVTSRTAIRTVNGLVNPVIKTQPGETQFWRIVNTTANLYYRLTLGGQKFWVIAEDANPTVRMSPVTEYLLDPSVRVEAMVQFPTASEYVLKTEKVRTGPAGDGYPATDLTTILCEGPAVKPVALPQARAACCAGSVEDYTKLNIDNKRLIVFNETDSDFRVNDKIFDEDRIDTRVALGTVEEWTISHSTDVFLTTRDGRVVKRFDLIAPAEEIAREARLAVEKHAALPAAGAPAIVTANVGGQP